MADLNLTILIITSNVNGHYTSIKRQRLSDWLDKIKSSYMLQEIDTPKTTTQMAENNKIEKIYTVYYMDQVLLQVTSQKDSA